MIPRYSKTRYNSVAVGDIPSGGSGEYYKPRNSDGHNFGSLKHEGEII